MFTFSTNTIFFANDNTHYSQWGTIHLHDMLTLQETNPAIYEEFVNGNFVLHESCRNFSGVALDQAHEHNIGLVKSEGGIIGITENETALLRWMTSGPEICQLVKSYEIVLIIKQRKLRTMKIFPLYKKVFKKCKRNDRKS